MSSTNTICKLLHRLIDLAPGEQPWLGMQRMTHLNLEEGSKKLDTKVQCLLVIDDYSSSLTLSSGSAHSPNDWAQLWHIRKRKEADVYYIECKISETVLTAPGPDQYVVGMPKVADKQRFGVYKIPAEALWVIDRSIYGLEPGKMAVFRSVKYPGYVLDLHHGEKGNGTPVRIIKEHGLSEKREMQKWLLQVQSDR